MTKNRLFRVSVLALVVVAAIAVSHAAAVRPVFANLLSFTSSSTQSSVQVIVSNPNPYGVAGTLTLVLETANGVTRTWVAGRIQIPPGNSNHRVLIPSEITGVRWARVTNLAI